MAAKQISGGKATPISDRECKQAIRRIKVGVGKLMKEITSEKQKKQNAAVTAFLQGLIGNKKKAEGFAKKLTPEETERAFDQAMEIVKVFDRAKDASVQPPI